MITSATKTVTALLIVAFFSLSASAASTALRDNWHAVLFQDQHAGWMHETAVQENDRITTDVTMQITIKRGPIAISIQTHNHYIESSTGQPFLITATQKFAGQSIIKSVDFTQSPPLFTTTIGEQIQSAPLPDLNVGPTQDWLMPAAALRYVQEQMLTDQTIITYKSFDPSASSQPFTVTHKTLGPENVELFGRIAPAIKRTSNVSIMPGLTTNEYINAQGDMLKMTLDMGGISMSILATDKQLAQSEINPPELMASTLIKPKTPIPNPRKLRIAKLTLTSTNGDLPQLPSSTYQTAKRIDDQHATLTINLDAKPKPSNTPPPIVTHSPMIDGRDPRIIQLLHDHKLNTITPLPKRAQAIRNFVHDYMTNADLSVGMASASEVAQTRQGDCTEFAVLYAAMLRAANIPSRVATGLIYVEDFLDHKNIFGYHMWTQAFINNRWIDLDATLPNKTPFDATHILLSTSNLDNEMHNDMIIIAKIIGQIDIQYTP